MHRTLRVAAVMLVTSSLTACGSAGRTGEASNEPTVSVKIAVAARAPFVDRYEASGTVASKTTSPLASRVMGQVTVVRVREGDRVRAGQVLVEIEARDVTANATRARAGVTEAEQGLVEVDRAIDAAKQAQAAAAAGRDLAKATYDRYSRLLEARSVSPQEFDEVETRYKMASAEYQRASSNVDVQRARRAQSLSRIDGARAESESVAVTLGYTKVVALSDGIVVRKTAEVGMMAQPGVPLLVVEDASSYRLEASVEESYAARVSIGAEVPVRIDALDGLEVAGTVAEIRPSADPASRSVIVKIDLPANPGLRSGQYGVAAFPAGERIALTVPESALVVRGQLVGIFVVDATGAARLRFVTAGKRSGGSVEVLSGLDEGERYVTTDSGSLTDGRMVKAA